MSPTLPVSAHASRSARSLPTRSRQRSDLAPSALYSIRNRVHGALFAAVLIAACTPPSPASADLEAELIVGVPLGIAGGALVLAPYAIFIGEAIDKGIQGHGLYEVGAILELVFGGVHFATGAVFVGVSRTQEYMGDYYDQWTLGVGIAGLVVGAWFAGHGIWSLSDAGRPPPTASGEASPPPPVVLIVPMEGGAQLTVAGRF